jgi:hypothetical protein
MHTLRFSTLLAQYLEAVNEIVRGHQLSESKGMQSTLHTYLMGEYQSFGNFSDPQGYAARLPSKHYLAYMMNKAIELDEAAADQHTACLAPDQIAIDDSHKVSTHMRIRCIS